jgi:alkylhydroperoxidase family enzyme
MPRIAPVSDELAGPPDLVAAIRARRGGTLLTLDRMLLHSPAFAKGWNSHLGAVRNDLKLDARLRELAICVVAVLNGAEYEFAMHCPIYVKAGGAPSAAQALRSVDEALAHGALFNEDERAIMQFATEMTRKVRIDDGTFARVRAALGSDQAVVEMIGVIATYNMVSRFLVALGIEAEKPGT